MSLANPIDANFHLEKSLEFFDNNSADKIWFKKNKEIKVSCQLGLKDKKDKLVIQWPGRYTLHYFELGI